MNKIYHCDKCGNQGKAAKFSPTEISPGVYKFRCTRCGRIRFVRFYTMGNKYLP